MARPKCNATTKAGTPCARAAGHGTDHLGYGNCKYHLGSTATGRASAQRQHAEHAVAVYGLPRDVEPHDALAEELSRTNGHVIWLADLIAAFDDPKRLKQFQVLETGGLIERPAIWLELYHRERRHLADVAKTCLAVGIEERRLRLAEQHATMIAHVIRTVLHEHGVDPNAPDVRASLRRHLAIATGRERSEGHGTPPDTARPWEAA